MQGIIGNWGVIYLEKMPRSASLVFLKSMVRIFRAVKINGSLMALNITLSHFQCTFFTETEIKILGLGAAIC